MDNSMMDFFINAMRSGGNPEGMIMQLLQSQNTPFSNNLLNLARRGDYASVEQIARNLCKERGIDFDSEFKAFKQKLGFR